MSMDVNTARARCEIVTMSKVYLCDCPADAFGKRKRFTGYWIEMGLSRGIKCPNCHVSLTWNEPTRPLRKKVGGVTTRSRNR